MRNFNNHVMIASRSGWRWRKTKKYQGWVAPKSWPLEPKRVSRASKVTAEVLRYADYLAEQKQNSAFEAWVHS